MLWVVCVTYGNQRGKIFSRHRRREDAEKLQRLAVARKYADAEVMTEEEYERRYPRSK